MRGYAPAQYSLGRLFERGVGVSADVARARIWYARAAEQGHVRAMHNLAVLSAADRKSADHAAAARWFLRAAQHGLTDSQYNLAILYQTGRGVEKNLGQAYKWFALAARNGDKEAEGRLAEVKPQLAEPLLHRLDVEIATWRPSAQ
jgi:localization factor PodJL